MANIFKEARNVELSLIYYFQTNLTTWTNINVVKSFKEVYAKDLDLPIIAVKLVDFNSEKREIASTTLIHSYPIIIDIFANSDGQRLDLTSSVMDLLQEGYVYYEHSHGSDKSVMIRTANGRVRIVDWVSNHRVDFGDTVSNKDKFRQTITIITRKS